MPEKPKKSRIEDIDAPEVGGEGGECHVAPVGRD